MFLSWKKHHLSFSGVFLCFWLSGVWAQEETQLYQKLAKVLYQNECGGQPENLVYWSPYESFPSFGIGHFIWLPEGQKSQPFKETFPAFIQFYQKLYAKMPKSPALPSFLQQKPLILPWQSRKAFLQAEGSSQMLALKQFLWQTHQQQSRFVFQRFWQQWQGVLKEVKPRQQPKLNHLLKQIMRTTGGTLLVLDYANFKGFGHNTKEQYQGQGWGLIEVLQWMLNSGVKPNDIQPLSSQFVQAAKQVLQRRIQHAPKQFNGLSTELHWQKGWFARLDKMVQLTQSLETNHP